MYLLRNFFSHKSVTFFLSSATLDVTGGGFVGSVPTELGVLPRLRRLDLSRNFFSGTIPPQLGDLSRLGTYVNRLCSVFACYTCSLSHNLSLVYIIRRGILRAG